MGTRFRNFETSAKIIAGVCVAVLLFADLLRDVHLLTATHVVCVAHGELIDATETTETSGATREPTSAVKLPSGAVAHAHEHCSLAGAPVRNHAALGSEVTRVSASPPRITLIASLPETQPVTVRVLAYAPKQGPPV